MRMTVDEMLASLPRRGEVRRAGLTVTPDGAMPFAVLLDGTRVTGQAVFHLGGS